RPVIDANPMLHQCRQRTDNMPIRIEHVVNRALCLHPESLNVAFVPEPCVLTLQRGNVSRIERWIILQRKMPGCEVELASTGQELTLQPVRRRVRVGCAEQFRATN